MIIIERVTMLRVAFIVLLFAVFYAIFVCLADWWRKGWFLIIPREKIFVQHIEEHLKFMDIEDKRVRCKICNKDIDEIMIDTLERGNK